MKEIVPGFANEFGDGRGEHPVFDLGEFGRNVVPERADLLQCVPDAERESAIGDDVLLRGMAEGTIDVALEIH